MIYASRLRHNFIEQWQTRLKCTNISTEVFSGCCLPCIQSLLAYVLLHSTVPEVLCSVQKDTAPSPVGW